MDHFQYSRHGQRYLSAEISEQLREELKLVELIDDTLFLQGGIKAPSAEFGIEHNHL